MTKDLPRPTLKRSKLRLFATQKTHWVGKHLGYHISIINAPDDIPSSPWLFIVYAPVKDKPDERGAMVKHMRHFKRLSSALNTAVYHIENTQPRVREEQQ